MYDSILVPLDGSELAESALPYAEELSARLDSNMVLIYACEPSDEKHHRMHELYLQKMVEATRRGLKKHLAEDAKEGPQVASALVTGDAAEQIVDYADKEDSGLIVMATHGRSGIRRWVLGSTAAKVARATKRPLVLVRAGVARSRAKAEVLLGKLLLPLDGSKQSELAVPYVEELAAQLKAEVVLLHVVAPTYFAYSIPGETIEMPFTPEDMERFRTKSEHYLETVAEAMRKRGVAASTEVAIGTAADEIIRLSDEMPVDLVVMSTHGRSGISRWAFGSVADKIIHAANAPVLLISS
jgi:nucleotide-binding universal stress UspA family protein